MENIQIIEAMIVSLGSALYFFVMGFYFAQNGCKSPPKEHKEGQRIATKPTTKEIKDGLDLWFKELEKKEKEGA